MLRTTKFWNGLLLLFGLALTIYVTAALFGYVRSSSQHYALFVCAVMVLTSFVTLRNVYCSEDVEKYLTGRFWRLRAIGATVVCLVAVTSSAYIFFEAKRLEMESPFFADVDFYIGLAMTVAITILTWIHWGIS